MKLSNSWSQYIAEFIGTFFLVFFGCGSMILADLNPTYGSQLIPVVWGGTVAIMIYAVGHISGAHFNPAVTIAFWVSRNFSTNKLFGYLSSQFIGALVASFLHIYIFGSEGHSFGATLTSINFGAAFIVEVILSFCLMFVIISVATDTRAVGEMAGIAIGSTVAMCAFVGGWLTKASMNPARSFAPALLSGKIDNLWLYMVAPVLGAVLGALVYKLISCESTADEDKKHGCC